MASFDDSCGDLSADSDNMGNFNPVQQDSQSEITTDLDDLVHSFHNELSIESTVTQQGGDRPKYKMTSIPRGICLIINNIKFRGKRKLEERTSSEIDEDKLKRVFKNLGFIVEVKRNQTAQEMKNVMDEMRRRDHSQYDCFVCCLLSHGRLGEVAGSDGEMCNVLQLAGNLRADKCESLNAKPKVFFIQACRDKKMGDGSLHKYFDYADFLFGYSTTPLKKSFRPQTGSHFITNLTKYLEERHDTDHILDILTQVNYEVGKWGLEDKKQAPAPQYTLRKDLYFPSV
ncbi:caspase-8-like [Antedon mediterranea]|uniref:caspase-8-like n=1 Tax=Antedon mediterranea TaxID=105859 RepID=UPI003AF5131F